MAKLSCSYFLVLMIVFSVYLMVEKTEGKKICQTTINKGVDCIRFVCRKDCARQHIGGLAYCFNDPEVPGPLNCRCTYYC
ncbi:hypothetical protein HID58_057278 [Brassica napus]|uniref:BnaC03g77360D protein n=2 Tax=Brassica napus TaxID=3708 RepID=A0A078IKA9_BRANA|nr:hypothetical protein HID58_057278 [Brassica napus]CAF1711952.1 unnamed protein product [Brassica napus]CDY51480.1 BnaC03g77360D [Brassica napus]